MFCYAEQMSLRGAGGRGWLRSTQTTMVQSVEKALRLLQMLDRQSEWIGVRELARMLGLSPPATHSLLKTLVAAGFAETNALTRQYRLGLAAVRLGGRTDPLKKIRSFSRPYIEALAAAFDETIVVLAWHNEQAHVVDWIQAGHPLAVTHHHGVVPHPVEFASGRVLLAALGRAFLTGYATRWETYNPPIHCPKTAAEFLKLMAKVEADGIAVTRDVGHNGVVAVAAPVLDANRELVVAIGCSVPIPRMTARRLAEVRTQVLRLTGTMSRALTAGAG